VGSQFCTFGCAIVHNRARSAEGIAVQVGILFAQYQSQHNRGAGAQGVARDDQLVVCAAALLSHAGYGVHNS
jgi:hypothetical protein